MEGRIAELARLQREYFEAEANSERTELLSIEVNGEKIAIVVFRNGYKNKENHPDWIIKKSVPREQREQTYTPTEPEFPNVGSTAPSVPDDEIPF